MYGFIPNRMWAICGDISLGYNINQSIKISNKTEISAFFCHIYPVNH